MIGSLIVLTAACTVAVWELGQVLWAWLFS